MSSINPAGQCLNTKECDVWLNVAPGISRSCLRATQFASTASGNISLGPKMPGFQPDPSSCSFPGSAGCPSLSQNTPLCQVATQNQFAQYTNPCYSSSCPTKGTTCTTGCEPNCQEPTGVYYTQQ